MHGCHVHVQHISSGIRIARSTCMHAIVGPHAAPKCNNCVCFDYGVPVPQAPHAACMHLAAAEQTEAVDVVE